MTEERKSLFRTDQDCTMGKVTILEETTRKPLTLMGKRAGICWGSDIEDPEKNYKRGLECLKTNHGRVVSR